MFSQITRLEFGIVVAVLLVLFVCRQPPKSGNADIRGGAGTMQQEPVPGVQLRGQNTQDSAPSDPRPQSRNPLTAGPDQDPQPVNLQPPTATASHNSMAEPPLPPPPQMKPLGIVDARKCPGLKYDDILYGEVTVRWVWDGGGFVAHKVVVVKEKSGVTSTWSFDDREDVVTTEIPQQAK